MRNFSAQASFDFSAQRRATIMAPKDQRQPALQTLQGAGVNRDAPQSGVASRSAEAPRQIGAPAR